MIIKKTAFCGTGAKCCPTVEFDTKTDLVTLTDDYDHTLVLPISEFLGYDTRINNPELLENDTYFVNISEDGTLSFNYEGQEVEGITLDQWAILSDTVKNAGNESMEQEIETLLVARGEK